MRIILNLLILAAQAIATFIALIAIYMILVLLEYRGGFDAFTGTLFFQPFMGALISTISIGGCLLLGLPIRLMAKINTWWTKRIWLPIVGMIIGPSLLILSILPSLKQTIIVNEDIQVQTPNPGLAVAGWFITAFAILHLFPPHRFMVWSEEMLRKLSGRGASSQQNRGTV